MRTLLIFESFGHGKNVAGNKKTSSIQVREYFPNGRDYLLKKQFRFVLGNQASKNAAVLVIGIFLEV